MYHVAGAASPSPCLSRFVCDGLASLQDLLQFCSFYANGHPTSSCSHYLCGTNSSALHMKRRSFSIPLRLPHFLRWFGFLRQSYSGLQLLCRCTLHFLMVSFRLCHYFLCPPYLELTSSVDLSLVGAASFPSGSLFLILPGAVLASS
jgi:hypothetical protein